MAPAGTAGSEGRAEWRSDRKSQRETQRDIDAFASSWNHGPVNRRFARAMATLEAPSAHAVAAAARALFADSTWVGAVVEALAGEMTRDPFFDPPFRHLNTDIHRGLLLYEDEYMSVAAGVTGCVDLAERKCLGRGRRSIAFTGQVGVFKFIRAGAARLSFWEAPRIGPNFSAARAGRCWKSGERMIADGEILLVDGRRQSFVIEHGSSNMLLLQATVKPDQAPVSVEYDADSHEYVGCSAADDSASRIQMITTLLRKLDCGAAFAALAAFVDHPSFYVRWHVMRELLGIDADAAMPHLRRMAARDPHLDVRATARSLLDRLEGGGRQREAA